MKLTVEELRELYQQRVVRSAQRTAQCLTEEALLRAAKGQLGQQEREQVADHLVSCPDCAHEYRVIDSLKSWTAQVASSDDNLTVEPEGNRKRGGWKDWFRAIWGKLIWEPAWRAAGVTAVSVIAIAVSFHLWRTVHPLEDSAQTERGMVSTTMKIDPPNRAILVEPPEHLAWSAVESAESFRVALYDSESTVIWESMDVTGISVQLPRSVRDQLQRGQPYYWRVITQVGIESRQSELFRFVISLDGRQRTETQ